MHHPPRVPRAPRASGTEPGLCGSLLSFPQDSRRSAPRPGHDPTSHPARFLQCDFFTCGSSSSRQMSDDDDDDEQRLRRRTAHVESNPAGREPRPAYGSQAASLSRISATDAFNQDDRRQSPDAYGRDARRSRSPERWSPGRSRSRSGSTSCWLHSCRSSTVITHLSNCDQSSLIADFSRHQLASRFSQQQGHSGASRRTASRREPWLTRRVTSASKQAQGMPPPLFSPPHLAGGLARGERMRAQHSKLSAQGPAPFLLLLGCVCAALAPCSGCCSGCFQRVL
jgi:hypothetical protein